MKKTPNTQPTVKLSRRVESLIGGGIMLAIACVGYALWRLGNELRQSLS